MESQVCPICKETIGDNDQVSKLTVKGVASILEASLQRKDEPLSCTVNQNVHSNCRIKYTHNREIEKYIHVKPTSSTENTFQPRQIWANLVNSSFLVPTNPKNRSVGNLKKKENKKNCPGQKESIIIALQI